MKTLFVSQDLWDLVEDGYEELEKTSTGKATPESQQALKENKKRDAKALFLIQQGISKNLFPRLLSATTSKNAWEILKIEFQGSQKVISIKLQSLWREFDNLLMKENESIQKTLRSLPPKFDHVVAAIEESKDLAAFSLHELIGSLEAHEKRINRSTDHSLEQAFQSKLDSKEKEDKQKGESQKSQNRKSKGESHWRKNHNKGNYNNNNQQGRNHQNNQNGVPDAEYPTILKEIADIRKIMKPISQKIMTLQSNYFIHVSALVKNHKIYENVNSQVKLGDGKLHNVKGKGIISVQTREVAKIKMMANKVFPLIMTSKENYVLKAENVEESHLWHMRYGHLNQRSLQLLHKKDMVVGLPSIQSEKAICEGCIFGKFHRLPFSQSTWKARAPLELVHEDICGPTRTPSFNGKKYFLLFVDDYSRMMWVYFLEQKSEAFSFFKQFKAYGEKQSGYNLKTLRTDRGGEFTSNEFSEFCKSNGIKRELTASYTPQQNGVAERRNRTIVEMARSI
ncbi:unnamed protein product [Prunus armeniaca]